MKKLLTLLIASAFLAQPAFAAGDDEPKTKRACITVKDSKTGKDVEKCRTIKVHEKHEGTKVPDKAPPKKDEKKKSEPAKK